MSALHFLRPEWLWLLACTPLLAWWRWRGAGRASAWRDQVDPHLLARLLDDGDGTRRHVGAWLPALVLALGIIALAGPSWSRAEQPLWQSRAPLVVAMDLSGAMGAGDLQPSRLARARAKLDMLLQQRRGGEIGLLVFDQDAYVVAPLTDDAANVALFVEALAPDLMPEALEADAPSHAAPAILHALGLMQQAGFGQGDILVMSDHADAAAREAASRAAAAGFHVSALGVGTGAGAAWRDPRGRIRQAGFDPASLQALARAGKGRYAPITVDQSDLARLGVLDPRTTGAARGEASHALAWQDQGYWLLLPLLLLAALAFRRGTALAVLLACALLPWRPAHAAGIDWWQRDDQQAHARMQQGAEAYRSGDFDAAASAWRGLPGADAAYNLGNALAKQGRYEDAVAAYDEALRRAPGMDDAIANRKAVLAAMKRQPPSGGQRPDDKPRDEGGQGSGQGDDPRQPGDPGKRGQPQAGDTNGSQGDQGDARGDAGAQDPATPADAAAQRDADAAQRERMQQAIEEGRGKGDGDPAAATTGESTSEREQRLANDAWLRRIPDDPGGLLRERLRLEHLRREREGR